MELKLDESNWAHACRVLHLDASGVVVVPADRSIAAASTQSSVESGSDLHSPSIVVECGTRQPSVKGA
jgi:hypothetical protein